jgi:hypothetical protein
MRCAMSSCRDGGLHPSSRPQSTSVGQAISDRSAVASGRARSARCCAPPVGMHHRLHPLPSHRAHAAQAREVDQRHPSGALAMPGLVLRPCLVARVEQRKPAHALARAAVDLERHAAAHRMAGDGERRRRRCQDGVRHRRQGIERSILGDGGGRPALEDGDLRGPGRAIAGEAGQEDDVISNCHSSASRLRRRGARAGAQSTLPPRWHAGPPRAAALDYSPPPSTETPGAQERS